jgi:SAM-dependent methyltransferase
VTFENNPKLVRSVSACSGCGYVSIAELPLDRYRGKTSVDELPSGGTRIGTQEKPGREFKMARMAIDILGRTDLEVLVYGIGRSLDNHHIAAMHRVKSVAIGDIMRLRDDAEFHDANEPARKQFPVVVASEVIEHFRSPREDFAKLFQFVARDGLLVCGTNVYDGGDLTRDRYIYWPDHTSYYTPLALFEITKAGRFHLDFRTPKMAGGFGRKRYVFFTRSAQVLQNISLYFGTAAVAPSE